MSLLSRIANILRPRRLTGEIDEELQSHLAEAIEHGRDPGEARRAFGSPLRHREESRDVRLLPWLDSLRADAVFGSRQLVKNKAASAVAILSLAIAIGACAGAFRLIDALLLRPLPVANSERLYDVARQGADSNGKPVSFDGWAYPSFQTMRAAVRGRAELIAVSYGERLDVAYRSDQEVEKAFVQYVSGWMFDSFGLRPALGRLFTENDDRKPGAHPVAVISYDYWKRRFARDSNVIGRNFRLNERIYEIVGVGPEPFTGTETGAITDIFLPTMMHPAAVHDDWTWHRTFALLNPGVPVEPLRARLNATSHAWEENRAKGFVGMTQAEYRSLPRSDRRPRVRRRRRLGAAAGLPPLADRARRLGRPRAADRLRQRRQSDDRAGRRPRPRNGPARLHRSRAHAARATGPGGKRHAGYSRRRRGRHLRLVVRAVRRKPHQPAR